MDIIIMLFTIFHFQPLKVQTFARKYGGLSMVSSNNYHNFYTGPKILASRYVMICINIILYHILWLWFIYEYIVLLCYRIIVCDQSKFLLICLQIIVYAALEINLVTHLW